MGSETGAQTIVKNVSKRYSVGSNIISSTFYLKEEIIQGKIVRNDLEHLGILDPFSLIELNDKSAEMLGGTKYLHGFELDMYETGQKNKMPEKGELTGKEVVLWYTDIGFKCPVLRQDKLPNGAVDYSMIVGELDQPRHLFEICPCAIETV